MLGVELVICREGELRAQGLTGASGQDGGTWIMVEGETAYAKFWSIVSNLLDNLRKQRQLGSTHISDLASLTIHVVKDRYPYSSS